MFSRRLRILLSGILAVLVIIILVLVLRTPSALEVVSATSAAETISSPLPSEPGTATPTPNLDQIVQTLFAQTVVAQVNVTINPATVVVNFPTTAPTVLAVFPNEARRALEGWAQQTSDDTQRFRYSQTVTTSFTINSTAVATNLSGDVIGSLGGLQEAWCVVTNPPIVVIDGSYGDREDATIDHFILNRSGARWEVRDFVFEGTFLQMGCRNW